MDRKTPTVDRCDIDLNATVDLDRIIVDRFVGGVLSLESVAS
jgi:hypothetical protein